MSNMFLLAKDVHLPLHDIYHLHLNQGERCYLYFLHSHAFVFSHQLIQPIFFQLHLNEATIHNHEFAVPLDLP